MRRFGFLCLIACLLIAGATGEEVASASVTGSAASPPASAPCECGSVQSELKTFKAKAEDCLKSKDADILKVKNQVIAERDTLLASQVSDLTSKHQKDIERVTGEVEQYKKVASQWQQKSTDLEKQVATLSVSSEKGSELERQLATLKQTSTAVEEQLKREKAVATERVTELEGKLTSTSAACQTEQSKLNAELQSQAAASKSTTTENMSLKNLVAQLTTQIETHKAEVESYKAEASMKSELIYSSSQFWKTFEDSRKIGKAFAELTHQRLVRALGPNTYELLKLQVSMLARRTQQQASELYKPLRAKTLEIYEARLRTHVEPVLANAKVEGAKLLVKAQDSGRIALAFTDNRMENLIRNLSTVDPSVRDLFPAEFHERCYAFAFVSLLIYHLTHIVGWVWATFVAGPIAFVFGRPAEGKKKRRRSSSKRSAKGLKSKVADATEEETEELLNDADDDHRHHKEVADSVSTKASTAKPVKTRK